MGGGGGGYKVNINWRKRCNEELMQLFGDSGVLSFVRIRRLNWICLLNRMDSKRKVGQVFNNKYQGSRLRGRPKTDGGIVYGQILINAKLRIGKRGKKELTGRNALRGGRNALGCGVIEEEEQEEEEEEEEEEAEEEEGGDEEEEEVEKEEEEEAEEEEEGGDEEEEEEEAEEEEGEGDEEEEEVEEEEEEEAEEEEEEEEVGRRRRRRRERR